jgi:hypothetical protein
MRIVIVSERIGFVSGSALAKSPDSVAEQELPRTQQNRRARNTIRARDGALRSCGRKILKMRVVCTQTHTTGIKGLL